MSIGMSSNDDAPSRKRGSSGGTRGKSPRQPGNRSNTRQKAKTKVEEDFDEDDEDDEVDLDQKARRKSGGNQNVKAIVVCALGVAVLIVGSMMFLRGGKTGDGATDSGIDSADASLGDVQDAIEGAVDDAQQGVITDIDGNPVYDADGNVIGDDAISPGYVTEFSNMSDGSVPAQVFDADDYISDLNGVPISGKYNVESIDFVYDYVEYEIKRAIIDNGMEMYWAEIEYEGKKYRTQMSYTRASKFKSKGIATAQLEVLNIVGGGKVITYIALEPEE
mgnify:CR=1 FL=1